MTAASVRKEWRGEAPEEKSGDGTIPHGRAQERVLDVLEALAALAPRGTLVDVAEKSGLPKPTVHRILALLLSRGYASQAAGGLYGPGLKVLALAGQLADSLGLSDLVLPVMEQVQDEFPETVHFGVLERDHAVYVAKLDARRPYRMTSRVGMELPLHCTAIGKAILSVVRPRERSRLLSSPLSAKTGKTITSRKAMMREIEWVARHGYAIDDEENESDVRCVAAPVMGSQGVYGAISISAPAPAMPDETAHRLGPVVIAAGTSLSALLASLLIKEETGT